MNIATLTSKGQVTIPKSVREALRLTAGDRIEFVDLGNGRFELIAATRDITELRGLLGPVAAPVTSDDMDKEPLINSLKRHLPRCCQVQNTHLLRVNSVFSPVRALHLLA